MAGGCVSTMLEIRPYICLPHFKEWRRMRMAKPERISHQSKAREVFFLECVVIGRNGLGNKCWK